MFTGYLSASHLFLSRVIRRFFYPYKPGPLVLSLVEGIKLFPASPCHPCNSAPLPFRPLFRPALFSFKGHCRCQVIFLLIHSLIYSTDIYLRYVRHWGKRKREQNKRGPYLLGYFKELRLHVQGGTF